ncbi:hypothetical protein NITHO_140023 [Nitrolancea hollandica Lb]|uniref:Uncharacterized protein n=1 Tax=Nitrolancea hollandica Lb TaxID=1129897 RepID=I4ED79_9BACT|nr:hypothetical protein NITHO_140023 [Nitrolancea hollandica Lb]
MDGRERSRAAELRPDAERGSDPPDRGCRGPAPGDDAVAREEGDPDRVGLAIRFSLHLAAPTPNPSPNPRGGEQTFDRTPLSQSWGRGQGWGPLARLRMMGDERMF